MVRLAATIIESLIVESLCKLLTSPLALLDILKLKQTAHETDRLIQDAANLAADWNNKPPAEQIGFLQTAIYRTSVGKKTVKIVYSRAGLAEIIQSEFEPGRFTKPDTPDDTYEEVKPVYLKRTGIESKLIVTDDTNPTLSQAHPETIQALQHAVSKAFTWNDALTGGQVSSMTELARLEGVVPQFIIRRVKFAYLAPDIVEAVFAGKVPNTLSLGALEKAIPLDWTEQRRLFGFSN